MQLFTGPQVEVGQPGTAEHGRRERILRAAIGLRDRILAAKTHYEALMKSQQGGHLPVQVVYPFKPATVY